MSDWKECRNYENCGGWLERPAQIESGLCENCLMERDEIVRDDEIATLRAELAGAIKSRGAAMLMYESARQSRDDLLMQQHEWQEALRTLDSERAANAVLTAQLAAAEARAEDADVLTDDMLRYAMAALGTNSPADADLYRAFWFHAITMRQSQRKLSKGEAG